MEFTKEQYEAQVARLSRIREQADAEASILDQVSEERTRTISRLVGDAWKTKAFRERHKPSVDPLLTKKFRTKAGLSAVRLEKLLLEVDKVETYGNPELREMRGNTVKWIQGLLQRADELTAKANRLVEFQTRLSHMGKSTMRNSLEATDGQQPVMESEPVQSNDAAGDEPATRKRRFASGSGEELLAAAETDAPPESASPMEVVQNE
jgi:hypothetical protein